MSLEQSAEEVGQCIVTAFRVALPTVLVDNIHLPPGWSVCQA